MKNNGDINFAEKSIYSLILIKKGKRNQNFLILKILQFFFMKNNTNDDFAENFIYSLIVVTKLKINLIFSILKILKILFNEK